MAEIKRQLQGDVTASETTIQTISRPQRSNSPAAASPGSTPASPITTPPSLLDYAKGLGVAGDPAIDRKSRNFAFQVTDDDALYLQDAFDDNPKRFHQPEDLWPGRFVQILFEALASRIEIRRAITPTACLCRSTHQHG